MVNRAAICPFFRVKFFIRIDNMYYILYICINDIIQWALTGVGEMPGQH